MSGCLGERLRPNPVELRDDVSISLREGRDGRKVVRIPSPHEIKTPILDREASTTSDTNASPEIPTNSCDFAGVSIEIALELIAENEQLPAHEQEARQRRTTMPGRKGLLQQKLNCEVETNSGD